MLLKKNTNLGIINFFTTIIIFFTITISYASEISGSNKNVLVEINILDKVSSKNTILRLNIGQEKRFQNLLIKVLKCESSKFDDDPEITAYIQVKDLEIKSLKCKNSEFDDNPEITAYIQVRDLTNKKNDEVFVFNGWMFSSRPSIEPFDHPVYDVWLISCY